MTGCERHQIAQAIANQTNFGNLRFSALQDNTTLALVGIQHATADLSG